MTTTYPSTPRNGGAGYRLLCALAAVAASVAGGTRSAHAQDNLVPRIDSIFAFINAETPGCAVAVSQNGKLTVNRAYGLADVSRRVPLSQRSAFDIGSVQKQFVAASVLLLVEDGKLTLQDDIRKHLPELPDYGHTITIDHLLTHTSGIRDWPGLLAVAEEGIDALKLILRQRGLNFVPGSEMSYSNSGYVLLKEIVERASGRSFANFTRSRLFEPLGMRSAAYVADVLQGSGEVALAYQREGSAWTQHMRLGNARGGGAIVSTPADLLIWDDALATGRLGAFVTQKLHEPARLNNGRVLTYARGLMLDNEIPGGPMVWHSGGAAGYSTMLARFAVDRVAVAVSCNFEPISATQLAGRVADLYLPPVDPQAQPPGPVAARGVDVSSRAGLFFAEGQGEPLRLLVNGGRLAIATGPQLVAVSADEFRPPRPSMTYRSEDQFVIRFTNDDELELVSMEGVATRYRRVRPYAPTEAELNALDGRYHSDELGRTFEIVATPKGIVWRVEAEPERAIELEPVAPDTYMQNMTMLRFQRDARGNVTGYAWSNAAVRNISMRRAGARAAGSAAPAAAAPQAGPPAQPSAEPPASSGIPRLEGLVGEYELAPGHHLTISIQDGKLYGQPAGSPVRLLTHTSGTTFSVADSPITLTFQLAADGRATGLLLRQQGNERLVPRVR